MAPDGASSRGKRKRVEPTACNSLLGRAPTATWACRHSAVPVTPESIETAWRLPANMNDANNPKIVG
jgi:hypothetical protein